MNPKVVLFFIDGIGIGNKDPEANPFFRARLPMFRFLLGGEMFHKHFKSASTRNASLVPVNATLGVPGLPQSGTGQSAIFTGVNAPKMIGRHFGPYPPTALRPVIQERNIFARLQKAGKRVSFANAYPKQFFDYTSSGTRRLTATTLSCMMSGLPLKNADDLRRRGAVSADLTRARWPEMGYPDLSEIPSRDAGIHLANLAAENDFTLFEYWLTDHAGHSQDMNFAVDVLERFDSFLEGFHHAVDGSSTTSLIISDHGNLEDLSTKTHTRNPVPCIAFGPGRRSLLARTKNLTHITPAIVKLLTK